MSNLELAKQTKLSIKQLVESHEIDIKSTLPEGTNLNALVQDLKFAIDASENNNSAKTKLAQCTPSSILACCVTATNLGLSINPAYKQSYLIPYQMGNTTIAQMSISYIGLVNMIREKSGIKVKAYMVYENEYFEHYNDGFDTVIKHKPDYNEATRGDFKCVVALAKEPDGTLHVKVMTKEEVEKCKKASPAGNKGFGPWIDWFDQQAMKSVIRRLIKDLPITDTNLQKAIKADEDVAIGRPQVLSDAYESMNITVEQPKSRTEAETDSAFDELFVTAKEVNQEQQETTEE